MLAFIDVSGDPYSAPQKSPWISISTVCIRKRSMYDITATLHGLKKDILANEYIEMKSTDLINRSTLNHPQLDKSKFSTAGLQLADISAGIMRNYYANRPTGINSSTLFDNKIEEYYSIIKARSIDRRIANFSVNGIFNPPKTYNI